MISLRWISVFALGVCAGYSLALYFHPDTSTVELAQRETPHSSPTKTLVPQALPLKIKPPSGQGNINQKKTLLPDSLELIHAAIKTRDWVNIVKLGSELINQNPAYRERFYLELEGAYIMLIRASLDQQDLSEARKHLMQADQLLDASAPRLILLAELNQYQGNYSEARFNLHQAVSTDPSFGETIYPLIRQVVTALVTSIEKPLAFKEKINVLMEEIINDPNFVTYYSLLGRLQYQHGAYANAIIHLEYALQLDHTQRAELLPLVNAAQQRLNTPGLIEIPISPQGKVLDVSVRLNGAKQAFQFILDTGASFTAISTETAQMLGLLIPANQPMLTVSTANGLIRVPTIVLKTVRLKSALVENVPTVILKELNGYDGLLGLSFLKHFNVDINQGEGKLFLTKH